MTYAYLYNDANQRTRLTLADGSYWEYQYDSLGQVKSGKRRWSDGTWVAGQQFEYGFDDIGNRTSAKAGGDSSGANLRAASYAPNLLNQYNSRTVPGAVDILGLANSAATVTVNGGGTYRREEYFHLALNVNNGSGAVWQSVSVNAVNGGASETTSGNLFSPPATENYAHDLDGNLLSDGRWNYTWDAENRLRQVESLASNPPSSKRRIVYAYDCQGRRIRETRSDGSSGSYQLTSDRKYLYDGWRCVAEINVSNNVLIASYVWGLDLSGTFEGAGGVGGMLMVNRSGSSTHFYAYDGNGNVAGLVNATDASVSANYEYGPFGEPIRVTVALGKTNPFRWSTKYTDDETDLVYYGNRNSSSGNGRFLSRDLIEEIGGPNLFGFVRNDPINTVDALGLYQEGGHFYTTYIGAVIAGRRDDAQALAFYSQIPDEIKSLTAFDTVPATGPKAVGNALTFGTIAPGLDTIQRFLHSLDGGLAEPRRKCLRKLLQDSSLEVWELGLLIHAFGDSYAHSYVDTRPYLPIKGPTLGPIPSNPNPNFGREILYEAPFGHGAYGSVPDYVSQRPQLYGQYLTDLATTLNRGPLNPNQTAHLQDVLNQVSGFPRSLIGRLEILAFARIAQQTPFLYPQYGYRPENFEALSVAGFLAGPGNSLGFALPSTTAVSGLVEKIKRACCEK